LAAFSVSFLILYNKVGWLAGSNDEQYRLTCAEGLGVHLVDETLNQTGLQFDLWVSHCTTTDKDKWSSGKKHVRNVGTTTEY
jgi:hypothetical protein